MRLIDYIAKFAEFKDKARKIVCVAHFLGFSLNLGHDVRTEACVIYANLSFLHPS